MKHVGTFFKALGISFILFIFFHAYFYRSGDIAEQAIFTVGSIIIILLCYVIALLHHLIDTGKKPDDTAAPIGRKIKTAPHFPVGKKMPKTSLKAIKSL